MWEKWQLWKPRILLRNTISTFEAQREFIRVNLSRSPSQNSTTLFMFQSITKGDVQRIITSLPSNKAPSCDEVNAKILKNSSPLIAHIISSLINNSFSLSSFPIPGSKQKSFQFLNKGHFFIFWRAKKGYSGMKIFSEDLLSFLIDFWTLLSYFFVKTRALNLLLTGILWVLLRYSGCQTKV